MWSTVDSRRIEDIWKGLNGPALRTRPKLIDQLTEKFLKEGTAEIYDVQDLLWAMEPRFPDLIIGDLMRSLDLNVKPMFPRPRSRDRSVMASMSITSAEVAAFLIDIERIGFLVDPSKIVAELLEPLRKAAKLDKAEMAVFWFNKERHKQPPLTLVADPASVGNRSGEIVTPTGYRVEFCRNDRGCASMLVAHAPKFRDRPGGLFRRAA